MKYFLCVPQQLVSLSNRNIRMDKIISWAELKLDITRIQFCSLYKIIASLVDYALVIKTPVEHKHK